jgi:hypothetical protein
MAAAARNHPRRLPSRRGLLPAVRALIDHLAQGFAALQEE